MRKRLCAVFVSLCMIVSLLPTMAFAETGVQDSSIITTISGLCEHHTQHDDACGYTKGTAEVPCSHVHTEDCYTLIENFVHGHTEVCYSEGSTEPDLCSHVCSEESGCITKELNCKHEHDEACGYIPATEGAPCRFVCEVCNAQDSGNAGVLSDTQPEECTCKTLCTKEEVNADYPVCSAEGAELDKVCVGVAPMLPVTVLAADGVPSSLYVGDQQVIRSSNITYWTTNNSGELEESNQNLWNVKYDPSTATLTLKGAEISGSYDQFYNPYSAGIYAQCKSGESVALTIELIGENTITGVYGIYVDAQQGDILGKNASLNITGDGSLDVSGSNYGIYVKSGSGNASLTINNASVVASSSASYGYAGVYVMSSGKATDSPKLSITVNGGSLTASGSEGNDGIQFYVGSSSATNSTASLTVTDNAIVDAKNGGISASGVNVAPNVNIGSTGNTGGIVFDDSEGTVYGDVELQKDLEIGEGESLTLGKDASLTVPEGTTLTNNGTMTTEEGGSLTNNGKIDNNGTLTGNITNAPPKITSTDLPDGEMGEEYNHILAADGDTTNWSVTSGSPPMGLSLSADGKISGIPTAVGNYIFTVTATNDNGSDSKKYTIQIVEQTDTKAPVLTEGTVNRTSDTNAIVKFNSDEVGKYFYEVVDRGGNEPTINTNNTGTNMNNGENTITLSNLTTGAKDIYIIAKDNVNNESSMLKIEIPVYIKPMYSICADKTNLNFGSVYTGYTQPAAQTVTITNNGNQSLTLKQPISTNSFVVSNFANTSLPVGSTATFTVQPKAGVPIGTYNENIVVSASNNVELSITANFTVKQYSSSGGSSSGSSSSISNQMVSKIKSANDGDIIEITLKTDKTTLDKEVFEELLGKDITLKISLTNGVIWIVNGLDIPKNNKLSDIDMGVTMDVSNIPVSVINTITGAVDTIQISLKHNGEFGFTLTLSVPLGYESAGYWANLYWYNEDTENMEFQSANNIAKDGTAEFELDHASEYAIVIDYKSHEPQTEEPEETKISFVDVKESDWFYKAVSYALENDLMSGISEDIFAPNTPLTREMLAMVLYNIEGKPENIGINTFTDVKDNMWYTDAILWANENGIVAGYDNGAYGVGDFITREQFATILYCYANYKGYDTTQGGMAVQEFWDYENISDYAKPAMDWAVNADIIRGMNDNKLMPQGKATRAEGATMLMNFCENIIQ